MKPLARERRSRGTRPQPAWRGAAPSTGGREPVGAVPQDEGAVVDRKGNVVEEPSQTVEDRLAGRLAQGDDDDSAVFRVEERHASASS